MKIIREYVLDDDQIRLAIQQFVERELIDTLDVGHPIEDIVDHNILIQEDGVFESEPLTATVVTTWEVSDSK